MPSLENWEWGSNGAPTLTTHMGNLLHPHITNNLHGFDSGPAVACVNVEIYSYTPTQTTTLRVTCFTRSFLTYSWRHMIMQSCI